jgi:hypothetical protein
MPFVFLIIAVMFIVIGMRNQGANAVVLLKSEFTGTNSFVPWIIALGILGAIGYWSPAKKVADAFLGLVMLVMVISNETKGQGGGLFAQLQAALTGTTPDASPAVAGVTGGSSGATMTPATSTAGFGGGIFAPSQSPTSMQSFFGGSSAGSPYLGPTQDNPFSDQSSIFTPGVGDNNVLLPNGDINFGGATIGQNANGATATFGADDFDT